MEGIIKCKGTSDGRTYTCLYKKMYCKQQKYYTLELIYGSIKWDDNAE